MHIIPRCTLLPLSLWFYAAMLIATSDKLLSQAIDADSAAWWRETARKDLATARDVMNTKYIDALNAPGPEWDRFLGDATRAAEVDVTRVRDAAGYQSVLKHFVSAFDDAHVRVRFLKDRPRNQEWPGFIVRFMAGQFAIVESERPDVKLGSAVTGCDAKPIDQVLAEIMPYEQVRRHLELESTRAALARALFVDDRSSLRPRPTTCRIGGKQVALNWRPIANVRLAELERAHGPYRNTETSIENWGSNAAWVRMPTMGPSGDAARQFARIIEQAPSIRNKDAIVIDVRGNGGGSYNWFMGFLDSLYGPAYSDYYAHARLEIVNVMSGAGGGRAAGSGRGGREVAPVGAPTMGRGDAGRGNAVQIGAGADASPRAPMDRRLEGGGMKTTSRPGGNASPLTILEPSGGAAPPSGLAPQSPVHARVFLLTDNGCASACISFVDEMQRFPDVLRIGRETYVDSREGSPNNFDLPSGEASISVPAMMRENRARGNNFAWKPDVLFDGDIGDTQAIRTWITNVLMK